MEVKNIKLRNIQYTSLTDREYEVLNYVMQGYTNKEIAEILMITHHTVKAHVASILKKTGARNRLHVSMIATEKGLINPHQD